MIGKRLAHYHVLEKIGSGGMGEVYRAHDSRLDRDVALKILPPELASDPERAARFEREARAIAALKHPSIVTIHAVEEDGGVRFLAMELVEGRTLTQMIPRGGLALGPFLDLALPLADAVAAAHAKGITHRDLKPDNVMIEPDGRLKVLDFGLAKLMEVGQRNDATVLSGGATQDGHILGTVAYMSPEQAEGKPVDPRSDVFSLGIVLYEMITGERPFQGDTQISTITAILRDAPRSVVERKHALPREVDRILQRCLEKHPDRRYETARGLRNDLETLRTEVNSQPRVSQAVAPPSQPLPRRRPPKPALAAMAAAIAAAVVAGAWWTVRGRSAGHDGPPAIPTLSAPAPLAATGNAAKPAMIVVFPFENLGPADDTYFAAGISEEITGRLATLHGLGVVSRVSAAQYDRTGKTMQQIAADLGVDYVLDGSVRWARKADGTSQVRITPQLALAKEDRQIWSNNYDRSMEEIFRIQSEIATEVVDKLGMTLVPREREALVEAPSTNVEAYHAFLRAKVTIDGVTFERDQWDQALELLDDAVKKDPQFLRAFAEIGKVNSGYVHFAWDVSEERIARAKAAVDRAVALDPASTWTHWGLGYYYYWARKDYENAFAELSQAYEGLPNSSEIPMAMGFVRRRQWKLDEALSLFEQVTTHDPRNGLAYFSLAETQIIMRRYDEARKNLQHLLRVNPKAHEGYVDLARLETLSGNVAAAQQVLQQTEHLQNSPATRLLAFWAAIACRDYAVAGKIADAMSPAQNSQFGFECRALSRGWILHFQGDTRGARAEFENARAALDSWVREHPEEANGRSALAIAYAHLGQREAALREGRMALGLYPALQDSWIRQFRIFDLGIVEMLTGHEDAAIERFADLLATTTPLISVDLVQISPLFDPLRSHAKFSRLSTGAAS